jgi:hypothetical protein
MFVLGAWSGLYIKGTGSGFTMHLGWLTITVITVDGDFIIWDWLTKSNILSSLEQAGFIQEGVNSKVVIDGDDEEEIGGLMLVDVSGLPDFEENTARLADMVGVRIDKMDSEPTSDNRRSIRIMTRGKRKALKAFLEIIQRGAANANSND